MSLNFLFQGVPEAATYEIKVKATDDRGGIVEGSFKFKVIEGPTEEEAAALAAASNSTATDSSIDLSKYAITTAKVIEKTEEEKKDEKPLYAWIESITPTGIMEIRYSVPVIPMIRNVTEVKVLDFLIEFEQLSDEPP